MPAMADDTRVSIKLRAEDYDAARSVTETFPIAIIDVLTAMRILWERASDKQRMDAIMDVRRAPAPPQPISA